MEIKQLKYFVEICRFKSFSKAADICYISPQGMSMSMLRLEEELGCRLFIRSTHGIRLTPQAEFLLPRAKKILSIMNDCNQFFKNENSSDTVLPLLFSHGTLEEYAGSVISTFSEKHPEVKIKVKECSDLDCDEAVLNEEVEMALTVGPVPEDVFSYQHLFSSNYALIVADTHPLANRESIGIEELKGLPLAVMQGGLRTYPNLRSACCKAGFEPNVQVFADNILLVFYMATKENVCGISTLHLFKRLNMPNLCAIPINSRDFSWDIYQIRKKDGALSPAARQLWQAMSKNKPSAAKK